MTAYTSTPPQLKEITGWVLLVHARYLKQRGRTWESVAATLRVDRRTLWRTSKRLLQRDLQTLQGLAPDALASHLCHLLYLVVSP